MIAYKIETHPFHSLRMLVINERKDGLFMYSIKEIDVFFSCFNDGLVEDIIRNLEYVRQNY